MNKKSILKKTFHFGFFTLISRLLGLPREILQIKYLGVGALSDAFIAAWRLPNFFRRIFAEGALSAAFIPTYVKLTGKNKTQTAHGTMTLSFIFFEGIVFLMTLFVFFWPHLVIWLVTPGFSPEQIAYAVPLLRILFPFLFFISSSALLSGALQAHNHFFAQSFGPVLHNIFYLSTVAFCLVFHKAPQTLATGILIGGIASFALHLIIYFKYHLSFGAITQEAKQEFQKILTRFLPCLLGVGVVEINLFLDNRISSYLPQGSYTLLYVANRFLNIPLGIFAVAFSTILLPHFSRITSYAPKRLHFYLLETAKFISWTIIPTMLFIFFAAHKAFDYMLPDTTRTPEAATILICYSAGLIFFCFNKVLINMFYALGDTWSPSVAAILATLVNLTFNIIGMYFFGAPGIAASTTLSGLTLTVACMFLLYKKHHFTLYWGNYFMFLGTYALQLLCAIGVFVGTYFIFFALIANTSWYHFFYTAWGYWLFTIPLFLSTMGFLFLTKSLWKTKVYFLTK